ncbi:MAG: response regulator [Desulfobacteraceae bacterium]|nr:response regulator [Desulfobacteraceae bacterium]
MSESQRWKVLLIDDESDIREVVAIALEDAGYEVIAAADGAEGVRRCRSESPQIVLTDIRMPKMNGIEVLEAVKAIDPSIEVVVVTAFGEMKLAVAALQLDASDFITKPINDEELLLALDRAKKRFESRRQLRDYTALLEREHARTAQELEHSIGFQRTLIENSPDGILGCDASGTVIICNQAIEKMTGMDRSEVIRVLDLEQFFSGPEWQRLRDCLNGKEFGGPGRLLLYDSALTVPGGAAIPVQISAFRIEEGEGRTGLVCFFQDLRQLRALEREVADQAKILHQDKMMSLGRLSASVVHEINNPLSGILNYIRLMTRILRRGPLPEDRRDRFMEYLDLVEKETDRCSHIVSSLLAFSRKSSPSFGPVRVDELIQRCLSLSRHKMELRNIELRQHIDPDLPDVIGDFNQLQQCVINLIFNAIDAMPDGGTLTVSGVYDRAQTRVTVSVADTGHGISDEDLPHIFEPFYTTKTEGYGVGLGLSTIFGIVERHNGTVGVDSRPGQGTTFFLHLQAGTGEDGGSGTRPDRNGNDPK